MIKLYKTVEDFVSDESFQNFVLKTHQSDVELWQSYIAENESMIPVIEESKFFVKLLSPTQAVIPAPTKSYKKQIYWLALVLCLSILGYIFYSLSLSANIETSLKITQTAIDNNLSITLPDESIVDLKKGATIEYQQDWSDAEVRKVILSGEAYFNVTKNEKPFDVKLHNGNIEVLGTKFLVRSTDEIGLVFLEEGKVSCNFNNRNFDIVPGDILEVEGDKISVEHNLEIREYDSWRKTKLSFKNISIEEIIHTINNSYGLNVVIGNDQLKNRKVTATVDENDPMLLLNAIAAIYDIKILNESNKLILK